MKKSTAWAVLIYGLILVILGYRGYQVSGSFASLYSGCGCGLLLILSSALLFYKIHWGAYLSLGLTFLLTVLFVIRYSMTAKRLPAILALLSGAMLLFLLTKIMDKKVLKK